METRKPLAATLLIILTALLPGRGLAYDDKTTHPALTQEMVRFFNHHYPELAIESDDAGLLIQGSIDEDKELRFFHHFYDPVHERGLKGRWSSSAEWIDDGYGQTEIENEGRRRARQPTVGQGEAESNYSWERALYDYAHGDREHALLALGHALHLLEDASVPDHTRNDAHDPYIGKESPYEHFTMRYTPATITTARDLLEEGAQPIMFDTPQAFIRDMAKYSNGNFFSRDTIFGEDYSAPVVAQIREIELSDRLLHSFLIDKNNELLVEVERSAIKTRSPAAMSTTYILDDVDNLILTSYFSRLSREAVRQGAGMIKLFLEEAEEERETGRLIDKYAPPKREASRFDWLFDIFKNAPRASMGVASVYTVFTAKW